MDRAQARIARAYRLARIAKPRSDDLRLRATQRDELIRGSRRVFYDASEIMRIAIVTIENARYLSRGKQPKSE